jgi:uncharacterized RDD family membrane protein YckC
MIGSMQHRPAIRAAVGRVDQLQLAPLKRRLVGGLIDMAPMAVGFIVADRMLAGAGQPAVTAVKLTIDSPAFAALAAGVGLYLLLTTVLELVLGRSLGKLLTGTRVAALDARAPAPSAVLIRNLLRIVDLMMLFFPLAFVIFSPLRQRVGDMAAGTIVVMKDAAPLPPPPPASSDES